MRERARARSGLGGGGGGRWPYRFCSVMAPAGIGQPGCRAAACGRRALPALALGGAVAVAGWEPRHRVALAEEGSALPPLLAEDPEEARRRDRERLKELASARENRAGGTPKDLDDAREAGEQAREAEERRREEEEGAQPLVTLPSGVQYRELAAGSPEMPAAERGDVLDVQYKVFRLASGAYFKYSSGGTAIYMWSLGFGEEGKNDLGAIYRFELGELRSMPAAATPAIVGMRPGGVRRILVPPQYGWADSDVRPRPDTFGAGRRLAAHGDEPLLLEVTLVRARRGAGMGRPEPELRPGLPFKLPGPPSGVFYAGEQ